MSVPQSTSWARKNPEKHRESTRRWKILNPEKIKEYNKKFSERHKYLRRRYHLNKNYGITPEIFERMSESQCHKCWVCEKEKKLAVDHSHKTGKVRSLLCLACNNALGLVKEDIGILKRLISYIEKHEEAQEIK